ncbi:MAG: cytochrome c oxidase subunit 4 [Nocardioides sp.]|uniref:cytochrome c oxidase subunit 4 n=1 Tax=Nocardioides nematodiphilus TaxID=2849669 RepID=UPI001CDA449F|nr:cytochrome c oxidase subunit 4 [Nocardioides nematodiphilus]MCA1983975.1 cytochrome c oxidase subunit 4 [Nocardioides nematodiphilus]
MKAEAWMFVACTVFLVLVTPTYWFVTAGSEHGGDWTGTSALVMCTLLLAMISAYLGFHARQMDDRPEDRKDGEIADGAGELGFFPPFSWWPLWAALCLTTITFSLAMAAWWLAIIGGVVGAIALCGWIFEYYRGEFSH